MIERGEYKYVNKNTGEECKMELELGNITILSGHYSASKAFHQIILGDYQVTRKYEHNLDKFLDNTSDAISKYEFLKDEFDAFFFDGIGFFSPLRYRINVQKLMTIVKNNKPKQFIICTNDYLFLKNAYLQSGNIGVDIRLIDFKSEDNVVQGNISEIWLGCYVEREAFGCYLVTKGK